MKNIINRLFADKTEAKSEKTPVQVIVEASVNAALKYAGLDAEQGNVISTEFLCDSTGSWCAVTFFDDATACRMNYTAYVDVYTGEVSGFSGEADKTWIDYPAQCEADIEPMYDYSALAIAV